MYSTKTQHLIRSSFSCYCKRNISKFYLETTNSLNRGKNCIQRKIYTIMGWFRAFIVEREHFTRLNTVES